MTRVFPLGFLNNLSLIGIKRAVQWFNAFWGLECKLEGGWGVQTVKSVDQGKLFMTKTQENG